MRLDVVLSLALLFCLVFLTPASLAADDDDSLQQAVIQWIRDNGGYFNPKQEFRRDVPGDPSTMFGIFATDDMERGDILTMVPRACIIQAGNDTFSTGMFCNSIHLLTEEMKKGNDSFYGPYVKYLLAQPPGTVPSWWTQEGKDVMDLILGNDMIHCEGMTEWLDYEWKHNCHGSDDPFDLFCAMQLHSRADDDRLIPLYDMYNHRNGDWYNTMNKVGEDGNQQVVAARDIKRGDQIFVSYNQCHNCGNRLHDYGVLEILRDYGFVEPMPQRWIFHKQDMGFDLTPNEDTGEVELYWMEYYHEDDYEPTKEQAQYVREQLKRLQQVVEPEIERVESVKTLPQYELSTLRQLYNDLKVALEVAVKATTKQDKSDECQKDENGVCALRSDFYSLHDFGEEDENVQTCDNEDVLQFEDYEWIEDSRSKYQAVTFMYREKDRDMCLDLDDIVQICTSYRPQYHEFVTHIAARYTESLRRAVFVGGGDSMVLHELLKYPDIELIVGLELDQSVVRGSFKHLHTQPHFDDERVQWWFGDASKSLLMLPKDYFGSFDLVVVDLSETVMSITVTEHLDILGALALLLKPDGIFVKNEHYFESLSEIFDHTIQVYITDNPVICDQAVAIGSNRIDFLHPDIDVLQKHNVEMLLLEPVKDPKDRFLHIHDYRMNDARAQDKCKVLDELDEDRKIAGILMILEAENTTVSLDWTSLEDKLSSALLKEGLSPMTKISHDAQSGGTVGMILTSEGVITARTWPDEQYCAFDIQMWGGFSKMEGIRTALANAVGSSRDSLSTYRIVTSGMPGATTLAQDKKTIGPVMSQNRDCEEKTVEAKADASIDDETTSIVLEESLNLVDKKDSLTLVAVLCGDSNSKCMSVDLLRKKKNKSVRDVVPIYTCPSIQSAPYLKDGLTTMFACEMETLTMLRDVVAKKNKLGAFVLDASASPYMAEVMSRLWQNPKNQRRLLSPHSVFVAPMLDKEEVWRRNFLGRYRRYGEHMPLDRAEVILKSVDKSMELGIVSTGDDYFYVHLLDLVDAIKSRTGLQVDIPYIQGGQMLYQPNYNEKRFSPDDYDPTPAKEQFAQQRPLGDQIVLQLEVKDRADLIDAIQTAFGRSLKLANFTISEFRVFDDLGDGAVFLAVAPQGTAAVLWDGGVRVDVNLFAYDPADIKAFVERFQSLLKRGSDGEPKVLLRDEMPRGTGRVVNFRKDLEDKIKTTGASPPGGQGRKVAVMDDGGSRDDVKDEL